MRSDRRRFGAAALALLAALALPASADPMPETRFWAIIDSTRTDDQVQQVMWLKTKLSALTPEEIAAFAACFDRQLQRANRWDLWGAAFVAMGGASDDGFEYFRSWLIGRGRRDFERVLADPDSLSAIAPAEAEQLEFEGLAGVVAMVWSARTGKPKDAMPRSTGDAAPPAGKPFSEDPAALAKRYPKLWRRFGERRD